MAALQHVQGLMDVKQHFHLVIILILLKIIILLKSWGVQTPDESLCVCVSAGQHPETFFCSCSFCFQSLQRQKPSLKFNPLHQLFTSMMLLTISHLELQSCHPAWFIEIASSPVLQWPPSQQHFPFFLQRKSALICHSEFSFSVCSCFLEKIVSLCWLKGKVVKISS